MQGRKTRRRQKSVKETNEGENKINRERQRDLTFRFKHHDLSLR